MSTSDVKIPEGIFVLPLCQKAKRCDLSVLKCSTREGYDIFPKEKPVLEARDITKNFI